MAIYMLYAVVPSEEERREDQHELSDLSGSSYEESSEDDRPLDEERNRGKRHLGKEISSEAVESRDRRRGVDSVDTRRQALLGNRKEDDTKRKSRTTKRKEGKGRVAIETQDRQL